MEMSTKTLIWTLLVSLLPSFLWAQSNDFNFHHINARQGLADGVVQAIGQDKYGYIWIGTLSGLNRYDGYGIRTFYNQANDSTSLPASRIYSIHNDRRGRLWIGFDAGLYSFGYAKSNFSSVPALKNKRILKMVEDENGRIYLATNQGLFIFNPDDLSLQKPEQLNAGSAALYRYPVHDIFLHEHRLYITSDTGLVIYETIPGKARFVPLPAPYSEGPNLVAEDGSGNVWLTYGFNSALLVRTDTSFRSFQIFDEFTYSRFGIQGGTIENFLVDSRQQLWMSTSTRGLLRYDPVAAGFSGFDHNLLQPNSLVANHITKLFQGKMGFIWIGTEGNGVDYFHPAQNLFHPLLPTPSLAEQMPNLWARAFAVDSLGAEWMGMSSGLIRIDPKTAKQMVLRNMAHQPAKLHFNSIRSLLADGRYLWIGTANGLNRLDLLNQHMDFFEEKDSLPHAFYWTIFKDSRNTVWFGTNRNLFYREAGSSQAHSIAFHPRFGGMTNRGVHIIFEDSRHRLWFGMNGSGLLRYDLATGNIRQWRRSGSEQKAPVDNTIIGIIEDKKGLIWMSSNTGLTSYDPDKNSFVWYTSGSGIPSVKTSAIQVDENNRLWIGSTGGLLLLDSNRRSFRTFDLQDGLQTMEFSDMPAFQRADGAFIYPSLTGFVVFNPDDYKEQSRQPQVFLSSIEVLNKNVPLATNFEETPSLDLGYEQRFFSLGLTALNFDNPYQTWYAYKLEGFDRDWTYTRDRVAKYTNVPGGDYIFRYKASTDPNNWDREARLLTIHVGTVFYRTVWFWLALAFFTALLIHLYYRHRLSQQRRILVLESKTQSLKKEKAMVMYESLKQQLNPHFLFNSLTSLESLIRVDQKLANDFVKGLSRMYRYVLKSRDHELVPLGEELKFVTSYISLQKTRFECGLEVLINIPETSFEKRIVPVTLQNLIENALKHNKLDDEQPLIIEIFVEGETLLVRNNLQKKKFVETSNKQGLANLCSLYHYLTSRPVDIIEDHSFFTIKIPLL
jgi:ligand-binding sensor domain-containing protein